MDHFIVSARKYRPSTFASVIGQASITTTLKNAIQRKHLAQAYLFCGPRGVGKTTCARIFAKTINCLNLTAETEPCNECESCKSFNDNRSLNIHELDAASNNSVEDIRTLIDKVRIPPQVGRYSVYIIDEVHMLSNAAFNAFLKTLEEPPAHAIFILATTEKHKIIPTILSRCQIFDFNRIKVEDTVKYLEYIAKAENVAYEVDAFNIIAQKADGAMRDALSIFDQVVSFSGDNITYQKVIENLNVLDYEFYFRLTDYFLQGKYPDAMLLFDEVLSNGFDAHNFIKGLNGHFRDLLVCKDPKTISLLEVGASIAEKYKIQATKASPEFLFSAMIITNRCDVGYKNSSSQRLHVELALVELCNILAEKKKSTSEVAEGSSKISYSENSPSKPVASSKNVTAEVTQLESKPISASETSVKSTPKLGNSVTKVAGFSSISIKHAVSANPPQTNSAEVLDKQDESDAEEELEIEGEELVDRPITAVELSKVWRSYAERVKQNKFRLYNAMLSFEPNLIDGYKVEFLVANNLQKEEVENVFKELQYYLRKNLSNRQVELTVDLSDVVQKSIIYTPEDKFKHMSQKNQALILLRQQMNLDFE
jgi:DNA polymerase III, subunit gamma and tau